MILGWILFATSVFTHVEAMNSTMPTKHPLCVAHRGASSEAPENTLVAMRRAIDYGADYLECDVHLTADGQVVLFHDDKTGRTTGGQPAPIEELSWEALSALEVGEWFGTEFTGERIPRLEDLLNLELGRTGLMIELKCSDERADQLVEAVLSRLEAAHIPQEQALIACFNEKAVDHLVSVTHPYRVMGLADDQKAITSMSAKNIDILGIKHTHVTPALIAQAQAQGRPVWSYTIDDPVEMRKLAAIGLEGVITNCPRVFLKTFGNTQLRTATSRST